MEGHQEGAFKGKEYPTLPSQATAPTISLMKGEEGKETTKPAIKLHARDKGGRFVVSRVLKPKKDRVQLSFLKGDEFEYLIFVTHTGMASKKVVIAYEKHAHAKNCSNKTRVETAVGNLLFGLSRALESQSQHRVL